MILSCQCFEYMTPFRPNKNSYGVGIIASGN